MFGLDCFGHSWLGLEPMGGGLLPKSAYKLGGMYVLGFLRWVSCVRVGKNCWPDQGEDSGAPGMIQTARKYPFPSFCLFAVHLGTGALPRQSPQTVHSCSIFLVTVVNYLNATVQLTLQLPTSDDPKLVTYVDN